MKRVSTAQPLINQDAQGILIAGRPGMSLELLRRHIGDGSSGLLELLGTCTLCDDGQTEVAQQDLVVAPQQEVLGLDVAMNQALCMGILQGSGDLLDIGDNAHEWQRGARRMVLAQRAPGGIVHNEKRQVLLHVKIEDAHDMGMHEASNGACLRAKKLDVLTDQVGMQHFDGRLSVEVEMLSQVDVSKATLPKQTQQAIVAQVLSYTVGHPRTSSRELYVRFMNEPMHYECKTLTDHCSK